MGYESSGASIDDVRLMRRIVVPKIGSISTSSENTMRRYFAGHTRCGNKTDTLSLSHIFSLTQIISHTHLFEASFGGICLGNLFLSMHIGKKINIIQMNQKNDGRR